MNRRITLFILLLCTTVAVFAGRGGMYYKDFHVDAIVHPDNKWEITETIQVDFLEPRHGIYRYLPFHYFLDQKIKDSYGREAQKRLEYDVDVDYVSIEGGDMDTDYDEDFAIFRIGDPDKTVSGLQTYVLKYNVVYPYDRNPDRDFVFHSILGPDFEDEIKHFSFNVTFVKPLTGYTEGELKVYSGSYGERGNALNVEVHKTVNTLSGQLDNIPPHQGFTIYQELKQDYYEGQQPHSPKPMYICLAIAAIVGLIIAVKALLAKQPIITRQIEFYPPQGVSSAEVGTIVDETVNDIDIASLIPWFASQGYITIRECDEEKKGKDTPLEITRVKDLPEDAPEYQHTFFNMLFSASDTTKLSDIPEQPEEMAKVSRQLNALYTGTEGAADDKSLTHTSLVALLYIPLIVATSLAFIFSYPGSYFSLELSAYVAAAWTLASSLGILFVLFDNSGKYLSSKKAMVACIIFRAVVFVAATALLGICLFEQDSFLTPGIFIAVSIACFILVELAGRFSVSTPYRAQLMGHLLGLKEFIETAEKQRLETLLEDDPQYFYRIIPYALVLGISDKWSEQFKDIKMERPSWYSASADLNTYTFNHAMISNLTSASTNAITTISHDSSSVSSSGGGGGFSGGGGGGGGGGSW